MGTMLQNWWTTLTGIVGAISIYLAGAGAKMPTTRQEWVYFFMGLAMAILGVVSKDATTGSKPNGK